MYRIGEFSRISRTTVKTLRYYAEKNLLTPEKTDIVTGYRYYTTAQLLQLYKIQELREAGISISGIREILAGADSAAILKKKKKELQQAAAETVSQISRIDFLLGGTRQMIYSVTIKEIPEYIVYSRTMHLNAYSDMMQEIPKTGAKLAAVNPTLKCVVPDYCFCRYLDCEYRETDITAEYCQAVEEAGTPVDDIIFKTIPAVKVASILHKGPYESIGSAYAYVMKWIEDNGYVCCDVPRESYIDGIWNKESPDDWLTEIQVPVDSADK
ncbi:MAG TPA: MerR family transcriptional regulator [Methanocorpusculum sp.]|nr:MerR family transcriptional regulator [Methanocorpusculum sp.]